MQYFFPGNARRAFPIELIKPSIELLALGVRNGNAVWRMAKTIPQLFEQLEPLFRAQFRDVNGTHTGKYTTIIRPLGRFSPS